MDANALQERSADEIEAALPTRPTTSVRDVQSLYGILYTLGRGLSGEYGPFLSPDAAGKLIGKKRLVVVRVDVTDATATLADDPVRVVTYTEKQPRPTREGLVPDVQHVAHAKFEAARGVDHSITHVSGQSNGPEKHADHACERFTRWPEENAVQIEAAEHEDGWLLEALGNLGKNEDAMEKLRLVVASATQEDQYLHTVAIRLDSDAVSTTDQFESSATWHLPGEIEVLQKAMVRRKTTKFRAKNNATDASGDGVCYVNDTEEEVYGVVGDPLKWYLSKQMERFPRFDADQAWRTQGLGREAAIAAQNATTFLEACAESGPRISAFYFPYFEGPPTVLEARKLYRTLVEQTEGGDYEHAVAKLYTNLQNQSGDAANKLRFIFMVMSKYQKDRWRLLAFEPNGTTHYGSELAKAHHRVINSPVFGENGPLLIREEFELLNVGRNQLEWLPIVTGVGYFVRTCSPPDTDDDPSSDDIRFRATAKVVGGSPIDVQSLHSAYVDRIADQFDPDSDYPFPRAIVSEQHAQLTALANSGLLTSDEDVDLTVDTTMTDSITDGESELSRSERLDDFIERHDALSNGERRGMFALGALVGRISRYQRSKNHGTTAVRQHPIDKVTKHNVTQVATDVIDSNVVYSGVERYNGTMYAELMDEVVDGFLNRSTADWDLTTDNLRYYYALGIAYGLNDRNTSDDNNE